MSIFLLLLGVQAPTVTGVTPTPASSAASPSSVTVTLSAAPDAATVSSASVKLIGRGPDLGFGTGDDVVIAPTSVGVVGNAIVIDLSALTLANDVYRVRVSGTSTAPASATGPFGHWRLNEGTGPTASDGSGNARHGTLNGATWSTGIFGNALKLDGGGTRVDIDQGMLAPNWTVAMWVCVNDTINTAAATVLDSTGVGSSLQLEQFVGKDVGITEYTVTNYGFGYLAPLQRWIHLTWTSDAANANLYVNGTLSNTAPRAFNIHVDKFGTARTFVSLSPKCLLSEAQIYTRVLTGGEITALATLSDCVRVAAGNVLNGEFSGTFPTGANGEGGDFISHFGVNVPAPPAPFTLISPASGATGVSTTPHFTWAAATGSTSYTLQVATDAAFAGIVLNQAGIAATDLIAPTALAASTPYFWRVTAVQGGESTGASGAPLSFTTGAAPAGAVADDDDDDCGLIGLEFLLPVLILRRRRFSKR